MSGFKLTTYTKDKVLIDDSLDFSLDASGFSPHVLAQESVNFEVDRPYLGDYSRTSISFEPGISINVISSQECYVKCSFAEDQEIKTSGDVFANDSNFVVLKGCSEFNVTVNNTLNPISYVGI